MTSEIVTVNNVRIRVDCWGEYLPSKILEKHQEKPKELILVIPGNPGVTKFYEKFLEKVHSNIRKPIWILSHAGHDSVSGKVPSLSKNKHLYDLNGQVAQKNKFIEKYLAGVSLTFIGHSIGCKMILELLKSETRSEETKQCILLFPTLERMSETPNGVYLKYVLDYFLWLVLFGSFIFANLPYIVQNVLMRSYCFVTGMPPHNIPAIRRLVDPRVLSKVFFLAEDELVNVQKLDEDVFAEHGTKLKLYYGLTDGWTPLTYYTDLKEKFQDIDAEVCMKGFKHTFVLDQSEEVAEMVSSWLAAK